MQSVRKKSIKMFNRIYKLIENAKEIDTNEVFVKVISDVEVKKLIIKLNKIEQLFKKGEDADNKVLGVYGEWAEFVNETRTIEGVSKKKIAGEPYNFYDSGFFFRSFNVRVYKDGFTITANDETESGVELARKFGKKILGLTNESLSLLREKAKEIIIPYIRTKLLTR